MPNYNLEEFKTWLATKSSHPENIKQDYSPFQEYSSKKKNKNIISFPNLEKDAKLIIPIPKISNGKVLDYKNISQFTKNAPEKQQQVLWKRSYHKLKK